MVRTGAQAVMLSAALSSPLLLRYAPVHPNTGFAAFPRQEAAPTVIQNRRGSSQYQVNSHTTGEQYHSAVAMDADGDFVVVWSSVGSVDNDNAGLSLQAQRYDSLGAAQGVQFQVNSYTTGDQYNPAVEMDADGDFVVLWNSYGSAGTDGSSNSIQGQRYNSVGTAQGGQFQVNTYTTDYQYNPSVAMDADGDFVGFCNGCSVNWSSEIRNVLK
jgi:hypothetical protein